MALEFTSEGPRAQAFLTYGESGDWESPHFIDQTLLFATNSWRPILFAGKDIEADPNLEVLDVEGPRRRVE
jgi:acyl-homoserine-lactone acylase